MKILHTSDWHIGKQLLKEDLSEDLNLFFEWLLQTISDNSIDVLLISGDVFDQANPSQAALTQYYSFLKQMIGKDCRVIITGGNHDSSSVLNAPKEILELLDITVIGGATENVEDVFIPINKNEEQLVVAAVPFLKDKDIRKSVAGESYNDKIEQIRMGIQGYFESINQHYKENYQGIPFIIMGHLFVQGSYVSESMRDIQIGNQASVNHSIFGTEANYVALGHIHKPYPVSKSNCIYYSGSPISLSFSEKEDCKQVNVVSLDSESTSVEIIPVPKFRKLITFSGKLNEVINEVSAFRNDSMLTTFAEINVIEEEESVLIRQQLDDFIGSHINEELKIIKSRLHFNKIIRGATDAFKTGTDVSEVTPMEMFEKRLELEGRTEDLDELKNAFKEILEELNL